MEDKLHCSRSVILCAVGGVLALEAFATASVHAADVIAEWGSVKTPAAPELKPVTVDAKTTALLILDINKPACTLERRPRCVDSVPHIKKLMDAARAAGAPVFYTFSGTGNPAEIADPSIAAREGEAVPAKGPDKFLGSELEKRLKDKGVQTVIITGSTANGAVIGSVGGAAIRGFQVVVPVDGMSADSPYIEQYVAWHIANAPTVSPQSTLTRSDMIKF
jgi:nicotinamidase-related amidase